MIVFTVVYGALAVVEFKLITKAAKEGPPEIESVEGSDSDDVDHTQFATVY